MDFATTLIGALAVTYSAYSVYLRRTDPEKFGKLEAMKKQWGEKPGLALHVVAYSVVPFLFGIVALVLGLSGQSIL